jgi:hypothetical protein
MNELQTRIPAFLWEALQQTFYEQDLAFLRSLAPHIPVPLQELKRTLFGARGQLTTIHVGNTDAWWETQLCPLRCRHATPTGVSEPRSDNAGIWRPCGAYREGGGFCWKHRDFWEGTADLKHKDDPWFQQVCRRTPWRYQGEVLWVSPAGDCIREDGEPVLGIRICPTSGVATQLTAEEPHT